MSGSVVGALAAAIVVPMLFAFLRKAMPVVETKGERTLEELKQDYLKWELAALAILFVGVGVLVYPVTLLLDGAARLVVAPGDEAYLLRPNVVSWGLVAGFGCLLAVGVGEDLLFRRLLGERYAEYTRYTVLRQGWNVQKATVPIFVGLAALVLAGAVLLFDWSVRITSDAIVENELVGLGTKTHHYEDIAKILTAPSLIAPNGNTVHRREYIVFFKSGHRWLTQWSPEDLTEAQKGTIVAYISKHSGVPITEVPVLSRDDVY